MDQIKSLREGLAALKEKYPGWACQVAAECDNFGDLSGVRLRFRAYVDAPHARALGQYMPTIAGAVADVIRAVDGAALPPSDSDVTEAGAEVPR